MAQPTKKGLEHLTPSALELRRRLLVQQLVRQQQMQRGVAPHNGRY